jgi:hypothetical protein
LANSRRPGVRRTVCWLLSRSEMEVRQGRITPDKDTVPDERTDGACARTLLFNSIAPKTR